MTTGAEVSVDPVTATVPVAPVRVHSGAPGEDGAAVGQELAEAAEVVDDGGLAEEVSVLDPHPARARETAQAAVTEYARGWRTAPRYRGVWSPLAGWI